MTQVIRHWVYTGLSRSQTHASKPLLFSCAHPGALPGRIAANPLGHELPSHTCVLFAPPPVGLSHSGPGGLYISLPISRTLRASRMGDGQYTILLQFLPTPCGVSWTDSQSSACNAVTPAPRTHSLVGRAHSRVSPRTHCASA